MISEHNGVKTTRREAKCQSWNCGNFAVVSYRKTRTKGAEGKIRMFYGLRSLL